MGLVDSFNITENRLLLAFAILNGAYNRYRATNDLFSTQVTFPALLGLFMIALSFRLLAGGSRNFNWSLYWPLILILIGLGMFFNRSRKG